MYEKNCLFEIQIEFLVKKLIWIESMYALIAGQNFSIFVVQYIQSLLLIGQTNISVYQSKCCDE